MSCTLANDQASIVRRSRRWQDMNKCLSVVVITLIYGHLGTCGSTQTNKHRDREVKISERRIAKMAIAKKKKIYYTLTELHERAKHEIDIEYPEEHSAKKVGTMRFERNRQLRATYGKQAGLN